MLQKRLKEIRGHLRAEHDGAAASHPEGLGRMAGVESCANLGEDKAALA